MKKHLFIDGDGWKRANIVLYSPRTAGNKLLRSRMQDQPKLIGRLGLLKEQDLSWQECRRMNGQRYLERLASLIREKKEECARLIALEAAKPINRRQE